MKIKIDNTLEQNIQDILDNNGTSIINAIMLAVYPIGSIYLSVNSTSPATLFGGTWEQIKDRFLLSAGDTYSAGATGGEASHTLNVDELPGMVTVRANVPSNAYGNQNWSGPLSGWGNYQNDKRGVTVNKAHNNMPPYLVVYVWKRTA